MTPLESTLASGNIAYDRMVDDPAKVRVAVEDVSIGMNIDKCILIYMNMFICV
jgi:hypothetical protein